MDAIQEFTVVTSNATPYYGRTAGGVVSAVTRQGVNRFHGSAYEFLRNTTTSANLFFNNASRIPRPKLNRNVFGGSVGGPIEKNRLFFFLNYEGRPGDYQMARIDSLKKELDDVAGEFEAFVSKELPAVNKTLSQKKLEAIQPIDRKAWDAADADSGASAPGAARFLHERY